MGAEFQIFTAKEFVVNMWEVRKQKLYGNDSCPNQLQSQFSPGGLRVQLGLRGKGMASYVAFVLYVEYLLVHVMCALVHVSVLVGVN